MSAALAGAAPALGPSALYYATQYKWSVVPIHSIKGGVCSCGSPACGNIGKHPRTDHGFKDATKDPKQIQEWWNRWPDANVGVATGEPSGFVALDIDPRNGGAAELERLIAQHGPLPLTPISNTGGDGQHILFKSPNVPTRKPFPGIDFKANGGYIVAPPSAHVSGRSYRWAAEANPDEVELAEMPAWLLALVIKPKAEPLPAPVYSLSGGEHPIASRIKRASAYLARLPPAVSGQNGHDTLWTAVVSTLRGFDLSASVVYELIANEYNHRCQPAWSAKEIQHKVEGAEADCRLPMGYLLDDPRRKMSVPAPPRAYGGPRAAPALSVVPNAASESDPLATPFDSEVATDAAPSEGPGMGVELLPTHLLGLPESERMAEALASHFVAMAADLGEHSPEFAKLLEGLKSTGIPVSRWEKAVKATRKLAAPPTSGGSRGGPPSPPPPPPGGAADWESELTRTEHYEIKNTYGNLVLILRNTYGERLAFNEMGLTPMLDGRPLGDADIGRLREELEKKWSIGPSADNVVQAVRQVSEERSFHPVRAYLSSLTWDRVCRIDDVAKEVLGIEDPPTLTLRMISCWFVSAVARVYYPGCKVDTALVLVGPQGYRKSTFFSVLGGQWFADTAMDISNKDGLLQLASSWIYEWGELESVTSRKQAAEVKGFVTSAVDAFRPPFGRATVKAPRTSVIVGTTNEGQFLNDATGSRRFWVLLVRQIINVALLKEWRDQLWAEAVHRLEVDKCEWWLSAGEEKERETEAEDHQVEDAIEGPIAKWLADVTMGGGRLMKDRNLPKTAGCEGGTYITTGEVLLGAMGLETGKWGRAEQTRVGVALAKLRWRKRRPTVDGIRVWVYLPPAVPNLTEVPNLSE